ncbi:TPA: ABC transporter permease, partial [Clostridioides difficile]|nr:ABC transporter permease [Clostridioides difficile]
MKKIIYVLFTIELLIVSLLGLNIVKDNEINNILYNDTTSISVMFKDYKKLNKNYSKWIKDIADENNVAISKYVFNNNEKLSIYTTDTSLNNNIKLKSGKFPNTNSNEFISNINTNNSNQVGKFSTMSKDISILIRDFGKISEVGESGILYISTQNEDTINKILRELNVDRSIFVARLHDRYVNSNLYLNPSIIRDLILIILCFLATIIHYSISVSREASILRLNGYSKLDIIARVIKNILRIMILSSVTALLIYIIYILKLNIGVRACLYFAMFSIICILINILISILIVGFNSRSSKYVISLNGKKSYGFVNIMHFTLKIVFVSFLILSINNCILNYNMLQTQLGNLSEWDKAKNVYNLTLKDTGEQSLGKEEVIKNAKIKGFYKNLVEEKDAFLIDSTNFEKLEDGSYMYEINSKGKNP